MVATLATLSTGVLSAQDNYRPWLVGAGVSTVDFKEV